MSTFDSSSVIVGGFNAGAAVTVLNSLACHAESADSSGAGSNASTTWFTTATMTLTVASDEVLLILANLSFSISDGSASTGRCGIFINGSQLGADYIFESPVSSSTGIQSSKMIGHIATGYSGSITVDFKYSRNTGSGTIWAGNSNLNVLALKYRPA